MYIDSSSLLKFFLPEPEGAAVIAALQSERGAVISELVELEVRVRLRALNLGGTLQTGSYASLVQTLDQLEKVLPLGKVVLKGGFVQFAIQQHMASTIYLRTLDRLHLAAMEELGIERLMTHDKRMAEAARALGFEVVTPR